MIPNETKDRILDAAVIADVVGEKVKLKKAGSNLTGICPFHSEKTSSFMVSPAKNIFKCFGCGIAGDPVKFIMEHDKLSFPDALRYLAARYNILIEETDHEPKDPARDKLKSQLHSINQFAADWYFKNLFLEKNALILEYALSRFSLEQIIDYRIGFAPNEWQGLSEQFKTEGILIELCLKSTLLRESKGKIYDYFRNRLMFPISDSYGRVIGFGGRIIPEDVAVTLPAGDKKIKTAKYLNSPDTPVYDKGAVLYGLNHARKAISIYKRVFLVEGYTDVQNIASRGFANVVSPCGTALTDGQIKLLSRHTDTVVMVYDGDAAGRIATGKNGELLLKEGFRVHMVPLPDGSDPGQYFTDKNINELKTPSPYLLWLAKSIYKDKGDPEQKHMAVKTISNLLQLIPDESLHDFYIDSITKHTSISRRDFTTFFRNSKDKKKQTEISLLPKGVDPKEYNLWGFYAYKNQYYFADKNGMPVRLSNFSMKPLFHTISQMDSRRIFECINNHGHKIVADFDMNEMNSLQKFKKNIEERGNFLFEGNDSNMTRLKRKLYEETKTCNEVKNLGWQKEGFWAWSNGMQTEDGGFKQIDEHGIIEFKGEHFFIPAFSSIYISDKTLFLDERKFKYKPGNITSSQWSEKLVEVFGNNAKVAVGFWIAAVFRDHIINIFKNFPIFNLFGPKGTGKSQLAISLTAMFGKTQTPFNIHNGTKPGLAEHLSQFINGIAFIDEYKNAIDFDKIEVLKSIYDAIGRSRMNMDKKKKETTPVNSAVVCVGQDMMTADIALLSRTIFLQYAKSTFGDDEKRNYSIFKAWESEGFSHLTAELLAHRKYFEDNFYNYYEKTFADYNIKLKGEEVEDRIIRSMCSIVAAFRTIQSKMSFSFDYDNLLEFTVGTLQFHNKQLSKSNEIGTFWDIFESLFDEDKIINKWHFRIDFVSTLKVGNNERQFGEGKNILKFKFNTIAKLYSEHARRSGIKPLGADTLRFYLQNHNSYIGQNYKTKFHRKDFDQSEGKVTEQKQVTSAMMFMYDDLEMNLDRQDIEELDKVLADSNISKTIETTVETPDDDLPF